MAAQVCGAGTRRQAGTVPAHLLRSAATPRAPWLSSRNGSAIIHMPWDPPRVISPRRELWTRLPHLPFFLAPLLFSSALAAAAAAAAIISGVGQAWSGLGLGLGLG